MRMKRWTSWVAGEMWQTHGLPAVLAVLSATVLVCTGTMTVIHAEAAPVRMQDGQVFDPEWYGAQYPDVTAALGTDPAALYRHYQQFGAAEGRMPYAPDADLSVVPDYQRTPVMQEGISYTEIADDDDSVTFTFAGDINMDPDFVAGQTIQRYGLAGCFDAASLSAMRDSDIFMLNNEFTYSANSNRNAKKWTFQARPARAASLYDIGTDIVSLANNHVYDYGRTGFVSTLDTLDGIGMPYVGAGRNAEEAQRPHYYRAGSMTIAVIAATEIERMSAPATRGATATEPGVFRCYDPTALYNAIRDAKTKADYCIVFVHWGTEQRKTPDESQLRLAKGITDAGVNLIIGDHSHCQETIGWIGDTPVVYSLGNFVFANYTRDTCLFRVTLRPSEGKMVRAEYLPLHCDAACRITTPTGTARSAALQREQALSPDVHISPDGEVTPRN